ncbi:MAG: hypothetical protein ACYDGR_09890 [Candidatus Dormibacteria bacterium]
MPSTSTATNGRRRRKVAETVATSAPAAAEAPRDSRLLLRVTQLVTENKSLRVENEKLRTLLGRIEHALGTESIGRRRQPEAAAVVEPAATARGRATATKAKAKRPRPVVTDPAVLAKREAALEKARKALAAKRAAAKKAA